jgi:uncharacterized protein (TIGR02996 family)
MLQNESLLRAIFDNPGDDAVRLVYAYWLHDHGEHDRAELIRMQCQLAQCDEEDRPAELRYREMELLNRHAGEWMPERPGGVSESEFRRGFVEKVAADARAFLAHAAEWFDRTPLRSVRFWGDDQVLEDLVRSEYLERLDAVSFSHLGRNIAPALAASPHAAAFALGKGPRRWPPRRTSDGSSAWKWGRCARTPSCGHWGIPTG